MAEFFQSRLDYLFFFYGASFLLLIPLCLFLRARLPRRLAWTTLAWFGGVHGVNEWLDLLSLSLGATAGFDAVRLACLAASFGLLSEFGRASMVKMGGRAPGRWVLVAMFGLAGLGGLAGMSGLFASSRYVLGLGGGIWAAAAFFRAARVVPLGSRQFRAAAAGLFLYALAAGLVPAPGPFFPASWLNTQSFWALTATPIQLWRGGLALGIVVSLGLVALALLRSDRDRPFPSWFRHLLLAGVLGLALLWIGGWFVTQHFGALANRALRDDFEHRLRVLRQLIIEKMSETDNLVKFLTETSEVSQAMVANTPQQMANVDAILDRCSQTLEQSVCYLMDSQGLTVASSNRHRPDSFVGRSYAFRPYFQQAIRGGPGHYWALGVTSKEMGYYASAPLRNQRGEIIGVAVVKRTFDDVKKIFPGLFPCLVVDPHGIVVMANHPDLVLRSLWPLSVQTLKKLLDSKQFGDGPFSPILAQPVRDGGECQFQSQRLRVFLLPGFWEDWSIVRLESMATITQARLLVISITILMTFVCLSFFTIFSIMRDREEDYRQLFDNAVDMLILHDQGRIVAVNGPACQALGYTRKELLQMSFFDLEVGQGIDDLLRLQPPGGVLTTLTGAYRRRDGSTLPVEVRVREIIYQGQRLTLAAARDITERQRAEAALRESEQRFRDVAESAQEWVWEIDASGKYTYSSPMAEKLLGYRPEEILQKTFYDFFVPQDRDELMMTAFMTIAEKRPFREFINRNVHKDGSIVYLSTNAVPIIDAMGNLLGYRGADINITERHKAEVALQQSRESYRQLASQLITVQEGERQRLARELHDDLTQRLAVLAMDAGGLELNLPPASAAKVSEMRARLVKLSMDVHALSRQLHPSILDDLGLADAIASECVSLQQHNGLQVNFWAKDIPAQIPQEIAINMYRIAQEALRNVAKHARATTVGVTLLGRGDSLSLTIEDDGQGIDPNTKKTQGLGLLSMRERTYLMGGSFSFLSEPDGGTMIEVTAPLNRRSA